MCLKYLEIVACGLWTSHYLSALSCNAMLNMTIVDLKLISDADMYFFLERGMEGGVSYFYKRYSKVSSKYLKSCE